MNVEEFMTTFGVRATLTHLVDYVTHVGGGREVISRKWAVVFEHADQFHGDQRILVIDWDGPVTEGPQDVDTTEVLRDAMSVAADGRGSFEAYVEEHTPRVSFHAGTYTADIAEHPTALAGAWHQAAALNHRLREWASSWTMRDAIETIDWSEGTSVG